MRLFQGLIRFSPPKREPDSKNYVVEYTDKNIFEGAVGQIALDLLDGLVAAHRKAIEDFENGRETYYEIARPVKSKTKYSLQGTTQGNGLTGGLPPVRFSM